MNRSGTRGEYRRRDLRSLLTGGRCLDLGGDHRDTVLITGSARSATTWLSTLIDPEDELRYIFEPFHPRKVAAFRHLPRRPYLRPDAAHPEHLTPVGEVLCGRLRDRWSDRHNRAFVARRRLVKEVRANLMLGWLSRRFPGMKKVHIVRHPCAVVESRLRLGWRDGLDDFITRSTLLEDYPEPLARLLQTAKTPFERGLLAWCIENHVPLAQLRNADRTTRDTLYVLRYEDIVLDPEPELTKLHEFLSSDEKTTLRSISVSQPEKRRPPEEVSFGWKHRVPKDLQKRANRMLSEFGLDLLYDGNGCPEPGGIRPFRPSVASA